jgi:hypothetical protein
MKNKPTIESIAQQFMGTLHSVDTRVCVVQLSRYRYALAKLEPVPHQQMVMGFNYGGDTGDACCRVVTDACDSGTAYRAAATVRENLNSRKGVPAKQTVTLTRDLKPGDLFAYLVLSSAGDYEQIALMLERGRMRLVDTNEEAEIKNLAAPVRLIQPAKQPGRRDWLDEIKSMLQPGDKIVPDAEYDRIYQDRADALDQMPGGAQGATPDMRGLVRQSDYQESPTKPGH